MTRRLVDILPQAVEEGRQARAFYLSKSPAVEEAFRQELESAIALIQEHPETWPKYALGTRRFVLNRFPYSLVYKTDGTHSLIVAIAHAKRKPGYWTTRVR
jgi:plasmid stabilization system protein ParE